MILTNTTHILTSNVKLLLLLNKPPELLNLTNKKTASIKQQNNIQKQPLTNVLTRGLAQMRK